MGSRVWAIGNPNRKAFDIRSGEFLGPHFEEYASVVVSIPFDSGMSGGPLFTESGKLLGMTTKTITRVGVGARPRFRYLDLEQSVGVSVREIRKRRDKIHQFLRPEKYLEYKGIERPTLVGH